MCPNKVRDKGIVYLNLFVETCFIHRCVVWMCFILQYLVEFTWVLFIAGCVA